MFQNSRTNRVQRTTGRGERATNLASRETRLRVEDLESRVLLYATSGAAWPHPELVSVSFMPDGADIAGMPSALFSTLNAKFPTATWQKEMLRGLQSYAANANLNFSVVSDDGSPFGSAGSNPSDNNVQGDNDFGDIRIGAFDMGVPLGVATLPPPISVDTTAGDFELNSTVNWQTSYDLFTVTAHEAGHGLGLCHSSVSSAVMYSSYNGMKSNLTSDDIAGIQAIYGTRPRDSFDAAGSNDTKAGATSITAYIDSNKQVTLTSPDATTTSDIDWYKIVTPSGSSSTITVKVQSAGLSLFAPKLTLYKGSTLKGTVSGGYNSTVTLSQSIASGQTWYIKVEAAESTVFGTGRYALQVNMGSSSLPAVNSPNTDTPAGGIPQAGCDSFDHDRDHDTNAADAETSVVVTTPTSDEFDGEPADVASPVAAITFHTGFDFDRSLFAEVLQVGAGSDAVDAYSHVRKHHAATVDLALDGDLADLLLDGLTARR